MILISVRKNLEEMIWINWGRSLLPLGSQRVTKATKGPLLFDESERTVQSVGFGR